MTKPKVIYFNAYGRAEAIRQTLVCAGVEFEDFRFEWEEWVQTIKQDMPFLQTPVLEMDGLRLCQSMAILKYLGKKYGLGGKTPLEDAQMDMIAYTVNDLRNPFRAIVLEKDLKVKDEFRQKYVEEQLPAWFRMFEDTLIRNNGGDGFFVGDSISWVDIHFACNMEPIAYKTKIQVDLDMSAYPKLLALIARVKAHPRIAEWLQRRPQTDC